MILADLHIHIRSSKTELKGGCHDRDDDKSLRPSGDPARARRAWQGGPAVVELGIGFPLIAARAILRDKDGPALMDRPVFLFLIADQTKN